MENPTRDGEVTGAAEWWCQMRCEACGTLLAGIFSGWAGLIAVETMVVRHPKGKPHILHLEVQGT